VKDKCWGTVTVLKEKIVGFLEFFDDCRARLIYEKICLFIVKLLKSSIFCNFYVDVKACSFGFFDDYETNLVYGDYSLFM
jgi:hypothetical protein